MGKPFAFKSITLQGKLWTQLVADQDRTGGVGARGTVATKAVLQSTTTLRANGSLGTVTARVVLQSTEFPMRRVRGTLAAREVLQSTVNHGTRRTHGAVRARMVLQSTIIIIIIILIACY